MVVLQLIVALTVLALALPCSTMAESGWTQYQGGPGHAGLSYSQTLTNRGGLNWSFQDPVPWEEWNGFPTSCAVAGDGTIYFGNGENSNSGHGCLIALNPNGTMKWKRDLAHRLYAPPVIGIDGSVLIASGNLAAYDPNGTWLWSFGGISDLAISSSPSISSNGSIFVADGRGIAYLSPNGTLIRTYQDPGAFGIPSLSEDGGLVYLSAPYDGSAATHLKKLAANGSQEWDCLLPSSSGFTTPCVAPNGAVYLGEEDGHVTAISADGALAWRFPTIGPVRGTPAVGPDGTIYAGSGYSNIMDTSHWNEFWDQRLYALSPDGTEKWSVQGGNFLSSPSINRNGDIFVTSGESIDCYDSSGALRWSYTDWSLFDRWRPSSIAIGNDGTAYVNTLTSIHAIGNGTPGAVLGLDGSLWGNRLTLSWKGVESIGSNRLLEFRVYLSHTILGDPSTQTPYELLTTVEGNRTTLSIDNIQLYDHFIVKAVNEYGESSMAVHYSANRDLMDETFDAILIISAIIAVSAVVIFMVIKRRR